MKSVDAFRAEIITACPVGAIVNLDRASRYMFHNQFSETPRSMAEVITHFTRH